MNNTAKYSKPRIKASKDILAKKDAAQTAKFIRNFKAHQKNTELEGAPQQTDAAFLKKTVHTLGGKHS